MMVQGSTQNIVYFKRFRMEMDLQQLPRAVELPAGYFWTAWRSGLLWDHADVKYRCFEDELDSIVFPNLGNRQGCMNLMEEITRRPGFRPEATWLLGCRDGYCGTVQGVSDRAGIGAIQNLGVTPPHRGKGLGAALLLKALQGFRQTGSKSVYLEVTAQNEGAVRMYHRIGFRRRKTVYKAVDTGTNGCRNGHAAKYVLSP